MARWQEEKIQKQLEEAFGTTEFTGQQLWALVNFAKHVRFRCRSNNAFFPFLDRVFPHAKFDKVQKTNKHGERYEGLRITVKDSEGNRVHVEDPDEE